MSETQIHVVQIQDRHGTWDMHGAAFVDEDKCREFVENLDIEWILGNVPDDVIVEEILKIPEDRHDAAIDFLEEELRKLDRDDIVAILHGDCLEEYGQVGGLHNWETVELKDGLDIHTERKTG